MGVWVVEFAKKYCDQQKFACFVGQMNSYGYEHIVESPSVLSHTELFFFLCCVAPNISRPLLAPDGAPAPILLPPSHHGQAVRAAAAGARHTALLLASGAVCVIGDHTHGQLGVAVPHRRNACAVRGDKGGVDISLLCF